MFNIFKEKKEEQQKIVARYELIKDIPGCDKGEVVIVRGGKFPSETIIMIANMDSNKKYFKKLTD